tara:strand:- start:22024 stop:25668 length:3645 start_codon:yes stop_codon:yes gene_type:complete
MYNRKFINGLKNRYKKGGIKKYQQGNFMDQEMDAHEQLYQMQDDHNEWVNSMTRVDPDGAKVTVGPVQSSFVNEDGSLQTPITIDTRNMTTLNLDHDKFETYSPFTQEVQTMFQNDMSKFPEYLKTLSKEQLNDLIVDMKDNDLMGLPGMTEGVFNENNANPLYTKALVNESITRFEKRNTSLKNELAILRKESENLVDYIERKEERKKNMSLGDKFDMTLSTMGMTPAVGIFADGLNLVSNLAQSGHSLITGDWDELGNDLTNVGWSIGGLLPIAGQFTGGTKMASNVIKATDKGGDVIKATDNVGDMQKHKKILDNRISEIRNRNLPAVTTKPGPLAKIDKGVNFQRVPNQYPIVKYTGNSKNIVNNPINKNAGKIPIWKRPFTGWGNSYKELKDAINSPMINWRPGNSFVKPLGALTRHLTTPRNMAIEGVLGYVGWNILSDYVLEPAELELRKQEDAKKWNAQQQEKIRQETVIYSPDDFDENIATGENIFNMIKYQGKIEDLKLEWHEQGYDVPDGEGGFEKIFLNDPSISDEEMLQIMISMAPLLWGEDADNNHKKFAPQNDIEIKAFGGYRRRQMGGGYMGVPQQGMGDEGNYMGKMQQFQMGGQQLPGGNVQQIPGSDAVQFNGQTHAQGGIMMDPKTEVEDGETMDQVNMAKGGGPKDYFFSSHLKKGGRSFAEHHKDILANGGEQGEIDMLAKMQEKAAGRDPNKVNVAKTGGYKRKYSTGGSPERNIYSPEYDLVEEVYKDLGYTDLSGGTTFRGVDHGDEGYENIQGKNLQSGKHTGYYGDIGPAEREGFYNRNKDIMDGFLTDENNDGVVDWQDFDPLTQTSTFQKKYNQFLTDEFNSSSDLADGLKAKGINSVEDYINAVGFTDSGHASQKVDNYFGSFTHGRTSMRNEPEIITNDPCKCQDDKKVWHEYPCGEPEPAVCGSIPPPPTKPVPCPCDPKLQKDDPNCCKTTEIGPGPLQLLPAAYAFSEGPDYMSQHPMQSPSAIIPERIAKTHLERVDMNADRARNASDARSLNKFIETSGGGSSNIVNKMAAYAKKREGDAQITDTENKTNTAIMNQELLADQDRKKTNVTNALDASKFNVTSQSDANKHNSTMEATVDEFNRASDSAVKDRRLMALDNAAKTIAGLYTDRKQYEAQERMAMAVSGQTGIYNREKNKLAYSKQLADNGVLPGTPEYDQAMQKWGVQSAKYGGYRRRYLK